MKKYHADEYSERGHSDLYGHKGGIAFFFEVKVYPRPAEPHQLTFLRTEGKRGAVAGILIEYGGIPFYVNWTDLKEVWSVKDRTRWVPLSVDQRILKPGSRAEPVIDFRIINHLWRLKNEVPRTA